MSYPWRVYTRRGFLESWGADNGGGLFSVGELAGLAAIASWSHCACPMRVATIKNGIWPPLTTSYQYQYVYLYIYMNCIYINIYIYRWIIWDMSANLFITIYILYIIFTVHRRASCDVTHKRKINVLQISLSDHCYSKQFVNTSNKQYSDAAKWVC